ncbi:DUF4389 domain-containing protein [Pseudoteredinibacter isoporae]|uniref:DUF4389 domain-containing protein n=1 Tax=Pseudoteredinibacter isoporae TaxID=570281 RepID=A0A7X0JXS1_9GAMM|nr:DUF4389 domain-containing protein [Pseudoteredinibacter isoporae]MBB6523376.1 hypothetical protein [Pseudoteredinibacter isoporae]NHO88888.1 DUF4389 domain-containing protein [Pseudoteredinibacter isoporae]NIB24404.1 DUF4389 domain-containing protein [Pseudoteredinibacter isoporae]
MSDSHMPHKYSFLGAEIWIRLVFMVIYSITLKLALLVLGLVAVVQFFIALIQGQANSDIIKFSESCAQFVLQSWRFLTFVSEDKPFPFRDWPT